MNPPGEVTRLLEAIDAGDSHAADDLLPLVYAELRRLAHARMRREGPGHTLQPTALVHEAYLRLLGSDTRWQNRGHFFAAAAEAMRRILIERARRVARMRHGGDMQRVGLETGDTPVSADIERLLAIDQALHKLEERDPRMAEVVKLRTFAGLTVPETAQALEISPRTVDRLWRTGRAFLGAQL
jgi:RNA polymerase sigma factor (TIGR02999 family)